MIIMIIIMMCQKILSVRFIGFSGKISKKCVDNSDEVWEGMKTKWKYLMGLMASKCWPWPAELTCPDQHKNKPEQTSNNKHDYGCEHVKNDYFYKSLL